MRNQGPLLRGINDDAAVLAELYKRLVDLRVVPYYLHQLDLARGTNHFRVPIERGIEIMRSLQGKISGIALPRYVLDLPGGKGKVPLVHDYLDRIDEGIYSVESPLGDHVQYHEPVC